MSKVSTGRRRKKGKVNKFNRFVNKGMRSVAKYALNNPMKIMKGAMTAYKYLNPEVKFLDQTFSLVPGNTLGTVTYVSALAQGSDNNNRIGRSIKLLHFNFNISVVHNASAVTTVTRIIFVADIQQNGTAPLMTDLLSAGATDVNSTYNITTAKGRFRILYDRSVATSNTAQQVVSLNCVCPFNAHVEYKGTTSGAGDAGKNNIYMMCLSDQGTNHPQVTGYTRIRYVDN